MSLSEIADCVEQQGDKTLSPVSVNKYLHWISALMKWATDRWHIPRNPAEGLSVPTSEMPMVKERRSPFSMDALNTIFSSLVYVDPDALRPSMFWAPIISLFHGMRLEEILQLTARDLIDHDGVRAFRIHHEGGNHLKKGAQREVPVHPKMMDFGFESLLLAARSNPNELLFVDVKRGSEGKFGSAFSQRYSRYLNHIKAKTRNTSFHSYRHNFRDAGRNCDVGDELTCAIGGWSLGSGVHKNYGSGYWMRKKADAIHKIAYSDVNFDLVEVIDWNGKDN